MKLALARAVFEGPDILLLDEPTNHMDRQNFKWLEQYLIKLPCFQQNSLVHSGFDHRWWENQRLLSILTGMMTRKQIR